MRWYSHFENMKPGPNEKLPACSVDSQAIHDGGVLTPLKASEESAITGRAVKKKMAYEAIPIRLNIPPILV